MGGASFLPDVFMIEDPGIHQSELIITHLSTEVMAYVDCGCVQDFLKEVG